MIALLILAGGLLALDATSLGQFMVSRPLPTAILIGMLLGSPEIGFLVGAVLEAFQLPRLPLGGAMVPEGGPAAVAATVLAVQSPGSTGFLVAIVLGLALGEVGGYSGLLRRRLNGRIVGTTGPGTESVSRIVSSQWICLAVDFLRGCALTGIGLVCASYLGRMVAMADPQFEEVIIGITLLVALIPLGSLIRTLESARSVRMVFGAGIALGVAVGWWV